MHRAILTAFLLVSGSLAYDTCAEGIAAVKPVLLPRPAFDGQIALAEIWVEPLRLKLESRTPNAITDDAEWFKRNGFDLPLWKEPNRLRPKPGSLPEGVPLEYDGMMLVRVLGYEDQFILFYGEHFSAGRLLFGVEPTLHRVLYAFDFSNYVYPPEWLPGDRDYVEQEMNWATEQDAILYVSHAHRTYASSSVGMNAYITAIDIRSGDVIWRTEPLVCNSGNFVIHDDVIICGYGFTAEPDFVYQLNRHTGGVIDRTPVKSAPDWLVEKDGRLYVRCYDTDYVFDLEPGR